MEAFSRFSSVFSCQERIIQERDNVKEKKENFQAEIWKTNWNIGNEGVIGLNLTNY